MGVGAFGGAIGLGALGAIGGAKKDVAETSLSLPGASLFQQELGRQIQGDFLDIAQFASVGPGQADVEAGLQSQRDFAAILGQLGETGFQASAEDISASRRLGGTLFQPQQLALQQALAQAEIDTTRQAALLGREADDPILRAKLAQQRVTGSTQIAAQRAAFEEGELFRRPRERFGLQAQRVGVLQDLSQQAFANRQLVVSLGQSLLQGERGFQLGRAGQIQTSGGGTKGAIAGFFGGLGAASSLASAGLAAGGGGVGV